MLIGCILLYTLFLTVTTSVRGIETTKSSPFGPLMCDRLCHHTVGCVYFFYAPQDLTCYLGNTSTALDREALKIASKIEGKTSTDTSKCSWNSKTHHSRSTKLICFKQNEIRNTITKGMVKCGEAPVVPGARKNTTGYFPGDVTTYTCNPDYTPCLNRTTSVCQFTGNWEPMNGLCGRFRWYKPKKKENKFSLPCGTVDQFMVTVLGKPTKPNNFHIGFWNGNNILLYVDCRLNKNRVVLNSCLNGHPKKEYVKKMQMNVGQNFNISVRLQYRRYMLLVDHGLITYYHELMPGVNPEKLTIAGRVFVKLVEFTP